MREDLVADIPRVTPEENITLTATFTEKEVLDAIMEMEENKAPGPDGFPAEFYQCFWEVIKMDLMAMFVQLQQGKLRLYKLNFRIITLIPKRTMQYKFNNIDQYACSM
jgi:hypothetical protein